MVDTYHNHGALVRRLDKVGAADFDWPQRIQWGTWSPDGYMTRAEENVGRTEIAYTYDWRGRRLEREDESDSATGPKRRYYFRGLTPIAEREGTPFGPAYIWSDDVYNTLTGGDLGQVLWRRTGGSTDRALHYDHIANVVAESNTSGAVTATHEQDAYGRAVLASYSGGWGDNSLHQTAKPWDDAIELYQFNARWYDQRLGQFASVAPMPREDEHQYHISKTDPLRFPDPTGEHMLPCARYCAQWDPIRFFFCMLLCVMDPVMYGPPKTPGPPPPVTPGAPKPTPPPPTPTPTPVPPSATATPRLTAACKADYCSAYGGSDCDSAAIIGAQCMLDAGLIAATRRREYEQQLRADCLSGATTCP